MPSEINVEGLDKLIKDLLSLNRKIGRKIAIDALKAGAKGILKQARANAPKRTGKLRRNIVLKNSKKNTLRRNGTVGVYISIRQSGKAGGKNNAFYGRFIEQGFNTKGKIASDRTKITAVFGRTGRKTLRGKTNVKAREFIHRAYLQHRHNASKTIISALFRGIEISKRNTRIS